MPNTVDAGKSPYSSGSGGRLLGAKRTYYLGLFRVRFKQVQFHRHQRLQDQQWIDKLRQGMQEGVDREHYPIHAVLRNDDAWLGLGGGQIAADGSQFLPDGIIVIVFDGRHRVEAWKECAVSEQDKWWYVTIYKQGEYV